mgnify:FL=1
MIKKTIFAFLLVQLSSLSAEATEIQLKSTVDVTAGIVRLSDVATVMDPDDRRRAALEGIELFPTPREDVRRVCPVREIPEILTLHSINLRSVRFTGPRAVEIQIATGPPVVQAALQTPNESAEPAPRAVVAVRALQRGQLIRPEDVEIQEIRRTHTAGTLLFLDDVVGKQVTRNLAAGKTIDYRDVQAPILVRRNQTVTVIARAPGVRVKTNAKAMYDASGGDLVEVQALDSRERYMARVTGPREVEVFAGAIRVTD